jgi:hypothetical protein
VIGFQIFDSPKSFLVARIDRQLVAFGLEFRVDLFDRQFCIGHFVSVVGRHHCVCMCLNRSRAILDFRSGCVERRESSGSETSRYEVH